MEKKQKKGKTPYIILSIVALAALCLLLTIIYYSVLKPQQPELAIGDVSLENGFDNTTLTQILQGVTLRMTMTLRNPNRGAFYYPNVAASMYYGGKELGFGMVPGGEVRARGKVGIAVNVATTEPASSLQQTMELEGGEGRPEMVTVRTEVSISGDVTVLGSFSHHTCISTTCLVSISPISLEVVTFICGPHGYENFNN